tara:strand:+ start:2980 stop:4032 length:1053 start_codon:yes stop_codon:yes gene_type:complete
MNVKLFLLTLTLICNISWSQSTPSALNLECIAFYNLENLFDTIVDPDTNKILQEDFTPYGSKNFNTKKYNLKLKNLAKVIDTLGKEVTPLGASIIGVCEIENSLVLHDLVNQKSIADKNYKIVHHEGPDRRGIDCALLYDPLHFKVLSSSSIRLYMPNDSNFKSRDQLLVTGELLGEKMHFIVIHWPSRRGGEAKSRPKRIEAAKLSKSIVDSIQLIEKDAKVVIMGDFNDDPISPSIKDFLKAKGNPDMVRKGQLFNTMGEHFKKGIGTLAYRDQWNLFDQFILTPSFLDAEKKYDDFTFYKSVVFNKAFLKNQKGNFKGYPFRSFVGSNFMGGYSDHFPVYMFIVKKP